MSEYSKLTGRKRSLLGYSQVWLGRDHILLLRSTRFTESYQRFALADIRAIVVTELPRQIAFPLIGAAAILACAAGYLLAGFVLEKYLFAAMAIVALAILIRDLALGPRCLCRLQTAVSDELLPPVRRTRSARTFLATIVPLIESVQGKLAPERAAEVEPVPVPVAGKPPEVPSAPGYLPETLCGIFLLNAALIAASARFPRAQLSSILFTTISGEIVVLAMALLRRAGRDKRRFVYALMIPAIFCIAWDAFQLGGSFVAWINGIAETARRNDPMPPSLLTWVAFTQSHALFASSWRLAAGAFGLAAAWFERR